MPSYDLACTACDHRFEAFRQGFLRDEDRVCPECGAVTGARAGGHKAGEELPGVDGAALRADAVLVPQEALPERLEPVVAGGTGQVVARHGYSRPRARSSCAFGMAPTACRARRPCSNSPRNGMPCTL